MASKCQNCNLLLSKTIAKKKLFQIPSGKCRKDHVEIVPFDFFDLWILVVSKKLRSLKSSHRKHSNIWVQQNIWEEKI